jgi:hypothetical protein
MSLWFLLIIRVSSVELLDIKEGKEVLEFATISAAVSPRPTMMTFKGKATYSLPPSKLDSFLCWFSLIWHYTRKRCQDMEPHLSQADLVPIIIVIY